MSDEIVALARRWIGTPYVHQASVRGAGCDCLGLLIGIWRDAFGAIPEVPPNYSRDWAEPQGDERLWAAGQRHLIARPVSEAEAGSVLLFRMRDGAIAKHLGIEAKPGDSFIHAYSGHGVVESPLSLPWRRRIVARFAFPEEIA
ncbi:peptidase [Pseudoprimorskyibacter insulae]|uniref:NlpC/P60 domain-containing protein n=1 Tax=Pseudoprimorskyibacter insulae TaxID=1695997 RepID=A0A2R8AXQ6_9RHOB|nr:peptidase [Pseudoprimorskyibacter insulae]SPF80825.1 hypothetical protein PRI8871_02637 [Pseudoprimorskyibacter insulae]